MNHSTDIALTLEEQVKAGIKLPLMESFYSLQGEGYHQGKAAHFIRLAGCNVGCVWCDVKESWEADNHPVKTVDEIVTEAVKSTSDIVIVTGGEPLMYNMERLTHQLQAKGKKVHLETSGAYPVSGEWDWVCLSPKKFKTPLPENLESASELKVVVYNKSDFDWAEKHAAFVSQDCKLFLQPEYSRRHEMTPLILEYVKAHPEWQVSLQIHKYLNIR